MTTKPGYDGLGPMKPSPALLVPRRDGSVEVRSPNLRRLLAVITVEGALIIKRGDELVIVEVPTN